MDAIHSALTSHPNLWLIALAIFVMVLCALFLCLPWESGKQDGLTLPQLLCENKSLKSENAYLHRLLNQYESHQRNEIQRLRASLNR